LTVLHHCYIHTPS